MTTVAPAVSTGTTPASNAVSTGTRRTQKAHRKGHVQRDTTYASTAGQGTKDTKVPSKKLSHEHLKALNELQREGYARVGKSFRVKSCGTVPVFDGHVALGIADQGGLQCQGLQRCGSRWCPDCWGKVAKKRAEDVKQVVEWAHDKGYTVAMVTLTAAHVTNETLERVGGKMREAVMEQDVTEVFNGLSAAWRYAHSGRGGQVLKAGRVGYARGFELTCDYLGEINFTGTHGHFHALMVFESGDNLEKGYSPYLYERWSAGCARQGLETSKKGYKFQILRIDEENREKDIKSASTYIVKGEKLDAEKVALEVARGDRKNARRGDRTSPEGLLRAIGSLDAAGQAKLGAQAKAQFRGIEEACKGRRWLTWSRDLRNLAGLGEELTDEEIANSEEAVEGDQVAVVHWESVRDHMDTLREVIRETKKSKKWDTLILCLESLGLRYNVISQTLWNESVIGKVRDKYNKDKYTPMY